MTQWVSAGVRAGSLSHDFHTPLTQHAVTTSDPSVTQRNNVSENRRSNKRTGKLSKSGKVLHIQILIGSWKRQSVNSDLLSKPVKKIWCNSSCLNETCQNTASHVTVFTFNRSSFLIICPANASANSPSFLFARGPVLSQRWPFFTSLFDQRRGLHVSTTSKTNEKKTTNESEGGRNSLRSVKCWVVLNYHQRKRLSEELAVN